MSNPRWKYQALQTTAFAIARPEALNRTYHLLRFPAPWIAALAPLAKPPEPGQPPRIPIDSLNRTLIALVPDIVTVATYATRGESPIWIMADSAINTDAIYAIVAAWVRVWARRNPAGAQTALARMSAADLNWQAFDVDFSEQLHLASTAKDTAQRDQARQAVFRLLPRQLAATLTAPGTVCAHGDEDGDAVNSAFRRCPSAEGAQIMSWPPHQPVRKPFSFTIDLSVHTLPLTGQYLLHTHYGVRRWVHKTPNLGTNKSTSVYLNPSVPWVTGLEYSGSFQRAALRGRYVDDPETRALTPTAVWVEMFTRILTELRAISHLGIPEQLRATPRAHLEAGEGGMALVYREGLYSFPNQDARSHPVKPGLALTDRPRLLDWVAERTSDALDLLEPRARSAAIAIPGIESRPALTEPDAQAALRASIRAATGSDRLRIGVFYDTQRTLDYAITTLQDQLGVKFQLPADAPGQPYIDASVTTSELTLTLTAQPVGALAADLDPKSTYKKLVERLDEAVRRRATQIKNSVDNLIAGEVGVALVEIAGLRKYKGARRQNDPKFAIRHGMNLAGWLTQFLEPVNDDASIEPGEVAAGGSAATKSTDPDAERLHSCWDDLWRQLGARRAPIPTPAPELGKPRYLAFYIIRQNQTKTWGTTRQVPLAVLMNHDGSGITVMAPDFKSGLPLHRAQLELGRRYVMGGQKRTPEQITNFFEEILTRELSLDQPTLLLTAAQNTRPGWKFLDNGKLEPDVLRFGEKNSLPLGDFPGLRHVRIRTDMRHETPEGYAVRDADDQKGHTGALWGLTDRIWYSTADKPATAGTTNRMLSRVETVNLPASGDGPDTILRPSPGSRTWNHQIIELAVVGLQQADDTEDNGTGRYDLWAALAHDLRLAHPSYKSATILPWPLHLAEQIGEYIVPIKLLEEAAEQEEEEPGSDEDAATEQE